MLISGHSTAKMCIWDGRTYILLSGLVCWCLNLYFSVWTCIMGVRTCILVYGFVSLVYGFVFWVSGFVFGRLDLYSGYFIPVGCLHTCRVPVYL